MAEEHISDPKEQSSDDVDISALDLPDEEFMAKGGEQAFDLSFRLPENDEETEEESDERQVLDPAEAEEDSQKDGTEAEEEEDDQQDAEVLEAESEEPEKEPEVELSADDDGETDAEDTDGTDTDVDYEAEYNRILSPFKANGKQIQVDNVDDAIQLMQMGANYSRKMQILKPRLKIIKMLENNDLLDENKINNLIDISKKDPKAVTKLLKDSGLDPLDINVEEEQDYKPQDYRVSEKEFNLDQAITDIKGSETFDKTMDVLGKQWDEQSRSMIVDNPSFIPVLDMHMQNGVYEKIANIMEHQKLMGKLNDVPDVVAYHQIAENLFKQGVLVDTTADVAAEQDQSPGNEVRQPPIKKTAKKGASKQKRRAAAPSRATRTSQVKESISILDMPDDEFLQRYS